MTQRITVAFRELTKYRFGISEEELSAAEDKTPRNPKRDSPLHTAISPKSTGCGICRFFLLTKSRKCLSTTRTHGTNGRL